MRPGIRRACSVFVAMNAACGPPRPMGTPKRWALPHGDVRAPFTRGLDEREGQQIRRGDHQGARRVRLLGQLLVTLDAPVGRRVLHEHAADLGRRWRRGPGLRPGRPRCGHGRRDRFHARDNNLDPQRLAAHLHDPDRLRVAIRRDKERVARPLVPAGGGVAHGHPLGGRRALIEERRPRERQAGEVRHHRLEVQQRFEAPLGDLRLVRRVLRVPPGFSMMFRRITPGVMVSEYPIPMTSGTPCSSRRST